VLADRSLRRRIAPLLLLAAGLAAFTMVDRELPHEHAVVIDLGDQTGDVTDVEVVWIRAASHSDEAELTTRWHFAAGTAPSRMPARVRLQEAKGKEIV